MTERSRYWNGTSTGDAVVAPYDAPDEFAAVQRSIAAAAGVPTDLSGVCRDELNEGAAAIGVNSVTIETLRALVHGTWYESDVAVAIAVPSPAASTRFDRIVLRKDWTAQTVRLLRIVGAEGAGVPPALGAGTPVYTQGAAIWDVTLHTLSITTAGTIVLTDVRKFIPVHGNQSAEGGTHHTLSQITGIAAGNTTPIVPVYGGAGAIGSDVDNFANDDHVHPEDEVSRGILVRTGSVTLGAGVQAISTTPVLASGVYYFEGHALITTTTADAADVAISFTVPAGTTFSLIMVGYDPTDNITPKVAAVTVVSTPNTFGVPGSTIRDIYVYGLVTVSTTPGNVVMLASIGPGVGNATGYMKATRV